VFLYFAYVGCHQTCDDTTDMICWRKFKHPYSFANLVHNVIRHATQSGYSITQLEIKIQMDVNETPTWILALAMINAFFSAAHSIFFLFFKFSFPLYILFLPLIQRNISRILLSIMYIFSF